MSQNHHSNDVRGRRALANSSIKDELASRSRARRSARRTTVAADSVELDTRNDVSPPLSVVMLNIDDLQAFERQVRRVDADHIVRVRRSIATFGICAPILTTSDKKVIDGQICVEACRQLGITAIPCVVIDHLSSQEIRLLRLALNRLQERGAWNLDELKIEFDALIDLEISLDVTGFEGPEIDLIVMGEDGALECDTSQFAEPDASRQPVSRRGDLFLLGRHRLLCGDARDPASYQALMAGNQARVVFTDPPYNIRVDGFIGGKGAIKHREFVAASGEMTNEEFERFLFDFLANASGSLTDGGLFFSFMDWRGIEILLRAARSVPLALVNLIVWSKPSGGMGGIYRSAHELVALFKKGDAPHLNNVLLGKHGRDRLNVWSYPGASSRGSEARRQLEHHPTPKPVALVADALLDVTSRDDAVLDPFCGSGTTIIAAEKTHRTAYALELDPHYVDVIVRRWQIFAGAEAIHAGCGKTFIELEAERTTGAATGGQLDGRSEPAGATDELTSPARTTTRGEA